MDENNVKALFRRGVARKNLGEYEDGNDDLRRVLELDPSHQQAKIELAKKRSPQPAPLAQAMGRSLLHTPKLNNRIKGLYGSLILSLRASLDILGTLFNRSLYTEDDYDNY